MEVSYTIVAENEADLKARKISVDSPIGKGLLGKSVGDMAIFKLHQSYEVRSNFHRKIMTDSIFTKIIKGEIRHKIENEHFIAFLDIMPLKRAHFSCS